MLKIVRGEPFEARLLERAKPNAAPPTEEVTSGETNNTRAPEQFRPWGALQQPNENA